MVSKARLDLPEPDRPVITVRLSRGSSTDTFFRLCTRAPCTAMVVRGAGLARAAFALPAIGRLRSVGERQLFHIDFARSEEHTSELQSPRSTLFPYTTFFRSRWWSAALAWLAPLSLYQPSAAFVAWKNASSATSPL